jgi:hypothetical protein
MAVTEAGNASDEAGTAGSPGGAKRCRSSPQLKTRYNSRQYVAISRREGHMEYSSVVQGLATSIRQSAARWQAAIWNARLARVWPLARYLLLVPALYELALILNMIWTGTTNIPWWDEWRTVDLVREFNTGTLSFQDLVAFHNEHRIILPRLVDLLLIVPTHWNRQVEMTFDLLVAVATYALLCLVIYRTIHSRQTAFVVCALGAVLAFTLGAATDWLAPFQIQFILTITGAAISVWALAVQQLTWRRFGLAALGAVVATLCGASGLMAWPAFFPVIWRGGWRQRAAWLVLTLVSWRLYFLTTPPSLATHHLADYNLLNVLGFAFAYLGAPVGYPSFALAIVAGVLSTLLIVANLVVYWLVRRDLRPVLPWVGLALFVLGCMALTDYGRVVHNIFESLYTRHQVFSVLWWLVLLVLVGLNVEQVVLRLRTHERWRAFVVQWGIVAFSGGVLAVVAIGFPRAAGTAWGEAITWQAQQRQDQQCVVQYAIASDACLKTYFWDPPEERPYAQYLQQAHLSIFYGRSSGSDAALRAGRR